MEDQLVGFETAKLAKEKGFDGLVRDAYYANSPELSKLMREECWDGYPVNSEDKAYLATPTQSLLQRWLREVHKIHSFAWCNASGWGWEIEKTNGTHISIMDIDGNVKGTEPESGMFKTYEDALEEGLQEALKAINKALN